MDAGDDECDGLLGTAPFSARGSPGKRAAGSWPAGGVGGIAAATQEAARADTGARHEGASRLSKELGRLVGGESSTALGDDSSFLPSEL